MKYTITDLEVESIYRRIKDEDIDLQPNFQRGEVWSTEKKKKLIDTILRGWQIPPIHLVENKSFIDEVLDGQQRLVAIRDFIDDKFRIDGNIKPKSKEIMSLNGYTFSKLDDALKRRIKKYSIRLIRITDYTPEESAELFYRLNQPTSLTSAEKRNAFLGMARSQVKNLVNILEGYGESKQLIGFSNSRMAYDDIISKLCYTLEINTLSKKITSNDISEKFISKDGYDEKVYLDMEKVLTYFMESLIISRDKFNIKLSLNKATLYSWLLFTYRNRRILDNEELGYLIYAFENIRDYLKGKADIHGYDMLKMYKRIKDDYPYFESMVLLFNQKSSMGSTDANSIIFRDIILQISKDIILNNNDDNYLSKKLDLIYNENQNIQQSLEILIKELCWGGEIS